MAIDDLAVKEVPDWLARRSDLGKAVEFIARSGARIIVLDLAFVTSSPEDGELARSLRRAGNVVGPLYQVTDPVSGERRGGHLVEPLDGALAARGLVELPFDPDGVVRRAVLQERDGEPVLLSLAATLLWDSLSPLDLRRVLGALQWSRTSAPLLPDGSLWIPFASGPDRVPRVSCSHVRRGAAGGGTASRSSALRLRSSGTGTGERSARRPRRS